MMNSKLPITILSFRQIIFCEVIFISLFNCITLFSQADPTNFPKETIVPQQLPSKASVWAFVLAGQSNMAGRGLVEPVDTIPDPRILTINKSNQIVVAKEPLHYYEPARTGLDCGLSFAKVLIKKLPDSVSILLIPTAVGGSPIERWLKDSIWNNIRLLSNLKSKIEIASRVSVVKGVLWHQGESNSNTKEDIAQHADRLRNLVNTIRSFIGNEKLPFLIGELGSFSKNPENFKLLNRQLQAYSKTDKYSAIINTNDLGHKGDQLHFNSEAQRIMGERFANKFLSKFSR